MSDNTKNKTENYKMNLPGFDEFADIREVNENFEIIDKTIKENEKEITKAKEDSSAKLQEHNTDPSTHANGISGNAATATRLKPALTGSRNQCWLLCKLPKSATALVHYKILGAQYYDQYSTLEVAIKNGFGWCKYVGRDTNYQVSVKAYDTGSSIDVYLHVPGYCDYWELFLQKSTSVSELAYKKVGDATYVPTGTLVCDTSTGLGMGGVDIFCGKQTATIDDVNKAGFNLLKRNTAYAVGDIAYSNLLPSWTRLECVKAGTTANTDIATNTQTGQIIKDGTATFIIDDIRDGHRVGNIILDHILRQGYVKANGAVLQAADYPRLVQFVIDNNLSVTEVEWQASMSGMYVYDNAAKTLRVPDIRGLVVQGSDVAGNKIAAGLPNVTGNIYFTNIGSGGADGAFAAGANNAAAPDPRSYTGLNSVSLNAARSSAIYGKSTTVQPPAITMIPQIKY